MIEHTVHALFMSGAPNSRELRPVGLVNIKLGATK